MADVLVTSAGRRVELVEAFREATSRLMPGARVLAADLEPTISSACRVADGYAALPRVTDPSYAEALRKLCHDEGIGLVVPTIDTELAPLAALRDAFAREGVAIIVSDADLVARCRDKRDTAAVFTGIGIDAPAILDRAALRFPCFAKPYDGSSSIGAYRIDGPEDLSPTLLDDPKMIFCELVDGWSEYTADAYFDRDGRVRCVVPRKRLATRAGEVAKGVTRRNFVHDQLRTALERLEGGRGCLTVQVFAEEGSEQIKGLEINARFGGGYPLAHAAGADFPAALIEEYMLGQSATLGDAWEADLLMLRYDAKVLVRDVR